MELSLFYFVLCQQPARKIHFFSANRDDVSMLLQDTQYVGRGEWRGQARKQEMLESHRHSGGAVFGSQMGCFILLA
jgi:hypothetical protein